MGRRKSEATLFIESVLKANPNARFNEVFSMPEYASNGFSFDASYFNAIKCLSRRRMMGGYSSIRRLIMPESNTIADDLRNAIRDSGIPLADLSKLSGIAYSSLSYFVNGKQSVHLNTAIALAKALNHTLTLQKIPGDKPLPLVESVRVGYINKNGMEIVGHELRKDRSQRQYRACIMKCRNCAREKTVYPAATYESICKHCRQVTAP